MTTNAGRRPLSTAAHRRSRSSRTLSKAPNPITLSSSARRCSTTNARCRSGPARKHRLPALPLRKPVQHRRLRIERRVLEGRNPEVGAPDRRGLRRNRPLGAGERRRLHPAADPHDARSVDGASLSVRLERQLPRRHDLAPLRDEGAGHLARFAGRVDARIQASAGPEAEHQIKRPLLRASGDGALARLADDGVGVRRKLEGISKDEERRAGYRIPSAAARV